MLVEKFDELGEVGERPGQAVDLVDDDDVDLLGPNLLEQRLQGRALQRGAGEAAIVEAVRDQAPALMRLALDIGLAGFALGVEGVEGEIEIMLGRFARIDRAALGLWHDRLRECPKFCVRGRVDHHAVTNLSSNMMANWVFASHHSRGGIFHSPATWLKTRYSSFIAASSVGKCPLVRTARRSFAFKDSMALVV